MDELKPCPFCGGDAEMQEVGASHGSYCVKCCRCWAKSVYVGEFRTKDAVNAWNRRDGACQDQSEVSDSRK